MGFTGPLPEHILSKISAAERKPMGKAGVTASEAQLVWQKGEERKLQALIKADAERRGYYVLVPATNKKSTIRPGHPDFSLWGPGGKTCCIEAKAAGGVLSQAQRECIAELQALGVPCLVATDLKTAIDFMREHLEPTP